MNISEDLFFNIVQDWKKREISSEEKSIILKSYLKSSNLSERELAKKLGVSHSTFHDWITQRQIKKYYEKKSNEFYSLIDRLIFLFNKEDFFLDNERIKKIKELKNELDKVEVMRI